MGKLMALDYGKKRVGIAITDPLQIIASGLTTVATDQLLNYLKDYITNEPIDTLIIGDPKTLSNKDGVVEQDIQQFIKTFNSLYPNIPIKRVDERFTSKLAFQSLIDSGVKKNKRQNKALIDEVSATIILQSYLHYR